MELRSCDACARHRWGAGIILAQYGAELRESAVDGEWEGEGEGEGGEGGGDPGYEWLDLFSVYDAPDEPSAIHIQSLLVSAGIEARIRSAQVPWLDGVMSNVIGYWGQVLVAKRDVIAARALLEELKAEMEKEKGAPWTDEEEGGAGEADSREHDPGSERRD